MNLLTKQIKVKTNRSLFFFRGNRSEHHNTELKRNAEEKKDVIKNIVYQYRKTNTCTEIKKRRQRQNKFNELTPKTKDEQHETD